MPGANARAKAPRTTRFVWFLTDNQNAISNLTSPLKLEPGIRTLQNFFKVFPEAKVSFIWCRAHEGIRGMEMADNAAKQATKLTQRIPCTPNADAINRRIKDPLLKAAELLGVFNPKETFESLPKLTRPDATLITQIRSGHCSLNRFFFRFKNSDSRNCSLCSQYENVQHLLLNCKKFARLRRDLYKAANEAGVPMKGKDLLTCSSMYGALSTFCRISHRFYKARHKAFAPPRQ
ncbi:hypothetical protein DFH28DRAFT_907042 [Melampsora americana]|nr:hypothetical protein DFH28DRAFT_907042 [Melampsora americana]